MEVGDWLGPSRSCPSGMDGVGGEVRCVRSGLAGLTAGLVWSDWVDEVLIAEVGENFGEKNKVVFRCVKVEKLPAGHPGTEDVREEVGCGLGLERDTWSCLCIEVMGNL